MRFLLLSWENEMLNIKRESDPEVCGEDTITITPSRGEEMPARVGIGWLWRGSAKTILDALWNMYPLIEWLNLFSFLCWCAHTHGSPVGYYRRDCKCGRGRHTC